MLIYLSIFLKNGSFIFEFEFNICWLSTIRVNVIKTKLDHFTHQYCFNHHFIYRLNSPLLPRLFGLNKIGTQWSCKALGPTLLPSDQPRAPFPTQHPELRASHELGRRFSKEGQWRPRSLLQVGCLLFHCFHELDCWVSILLIVTLLVCYFVVVLVVYLCYELDWGCARVNCWIAFHCHAFFYVGNA